MSPPTMQFPVVEDILGPMRDANEKPGRIVRLLRRLGGSR